jgi:hypothetical protein
MIYLLGGRCGENEQRAATVTPTDQASRLAWQKKLSNYKYILNCLLKHSIFGLNFKLMFAPTNEKKATEQLFVFGLL